MENIIFIAPPAAGKGTHSKNLKDNFGYVHISTGDMLRAAIDAQTPIGRVAKDIIAKGEFVSDEIMIKLISEKLEEIKGKPFILDGFPRTLTQAIALDELLNKNKTNYIVIYLDVLEEVAKIRMLGRLTCKCGKSYNENIPNFRPKVEGICDVCGSSLVKRDDDNEEAFIVRYQSYIEKTKPIIDYYQEKNKLVKIDANREGNEVFKDIKALVVRDK